MYKNRIHTGCYMRPFFSRTEIGGKSVYVTILQRILIHHYFSSDLLPRYVSIAIHFSMFYETLGKYFATCLAVSKHLAFKWLIKLIKLDCRRYRFNIEIAWRWFMFWVSIISISLRNSSLSSYIITVVY